jgi:hypothetical protein
MLDLQKILEQKEFYQLKYSFGPKLPINKFKTYTQQLFVARWMAHQKKKTFPAIQKA